MDFTTAASSPLFDDRVAGNGSRSNGARPPDHLPEPATRTVHGSRVNSRLTASCLIVRPFQPLF